MECNLVEQQYSSLRKISSNIIEEQYFIIFVLIYFWNTINGLLNVNIFVIERFEEEKPDALLRELWLIQTTIWLDLDGNKKNNISLTLNICILLILLVIMNGMTRGSDVLVWRQCVGCFSPKYICDYFNL